MAARKPRNDDDARRLLEQADLSTEEGQAQARAVIEWAEGRARLPSDLRVAIADTQAALVREDFGRGFVKGGGAVVGTLKWLWDKPLGGDLGRAIMRNLAEAESTGTVWPTEQDLLRDVWGLMSQDERAESVRRGQAPPDLAGELTRGDAAAAARLTAQAEARPGRQRPASVNPAGRERRIADLMASDPTMTREVAELIADELGPELGPLPIGVPEDHAMHQMPDRTGIPSNVEDFGRPQGRVGFDRPRYFQGDETAPLGWSVERITDLQRKLVAAGLLQGQFRWGWFDDPTGQAYTAALSAANQRVVSVWDALDTLAQQHQAQREEAKADALGAFTPEPFLAPDRDAARRLARNSMLAMGRRFADIDDDELEQLVSVYVGEFRRAHQMEQQIARRMHAADVETAFGEEGAPPVQADVSGLEQRDPIASFEEHFVRQFAGEIETRETGQEVARRGRTFDQGMDRMRGQVRGGGA